jgi:hypothetical protein
MERLDHTTMPAFQIADVLNVCFSGDGKSFGLEPPDAKLHAIERHDFVCLSADVVDEPGKIKHSVRHFSLELGVTHKDDHRLDDLGRQKVEPFLHSADMPEILEDRVLKFELSIEQDLRPIGMLWIREDPAFVIFGLDDEDTKPRYEDVINLRCAIAQLQGDVIHQMVVRRTEALSYRLRKPRFAFILKNVRTFVANAAECKAESNCEKDVEDSIHASCAAQTCELRGRRRQDDMP